MRVLGRSFLQLLRLACIVVVGVATMVGATIGMGPAFTSVSKSASSLSSSIQLPPLGGVSYLYDRHGKLQLSFNRKIRSEVPIEQVSTPVIESILAVEDSDFYRRGPVDARSILRALQANVSGGGVEQGGSTITQQVVKKGVVGSKRNVNRKLREARLAAVLEDQMTKDEILEYYLNLIYLGNNIYGVQAAAQTYWGKDVSELDWAQGALIAALIRNPNGYDPIAHPERAREQRGLALKRLVATGRISQEVADLANLEPLPTKLTKTVPQLDYFVEQVRRMLLNKDGTYNNLPIGTALGRTYAQRAAKLYGGGLRIFTTYDPAMQQMALQARQSTVPGIQPDGRIPRTAPDGSQRWATQTITSVVPATGAVRVLLGGPTYSKSSQVNIATGHATNPGSTFKSFVLAALFDRGYVPDDVVNGSSPCVLAADDPNYVNPTRTTEGETAHSYHNYNGEGGGVGTIKMQTLTSSNCGFARLGQIVGLRHVIDKAKSMGLANEVWNAPDPLGEHPNTLNPYSVQLAYGGAIGVSSLEMAGAYATFANDGVFNQPYLVDRIEDASGNVIWSHKLRPHRVMSMQAARLVNQVLEANVQGGTGTGARLNSQPAAGKTGTSDGPYDLWFAGYTPQLATTVWIGSTDKPFIVYPGGTGGAYSARTWRSFMNDALANQPVVDFTSPEATRRGVRLAIGPDDGMRFEDRSDRRELLATAPSPPTTVPQNRGQLSTTPTTSPPTTSPPVTAYVP